MGLILISLLLLIGILLYKYFTKNKDYWEIRRVPYIKPLPVFGNHFDVFTLRASIGENLANLYKKQKTPYFGTFVLNNPQLVVTDPELLKLIFVKDFNNFCDHAICSDIKCDPISTQILFFVKNPRWKLLRAKATTLFTPGKMKSMLEPIRKVGEAMTDYINKNVNEPSVEIKNICEKYVTDILSTFSFGVDAHSFESESAILKTFGNTLYKPSWKSAITQNLYFLLPSIVTKLKLAHKDAQTLHSLRMLVMEIMEDRKRLGIKKNDAMDLVIELFQERELNNDDKLEDDTILTQCLQYFISGHETTTTMMSYAMYELALNPKVQHKLRQEIRKNFAQDERFSYDTIQNMKYLLAVICETLRKYPVLPFIERMCVNDYRFPNADFVIEKGVTILIPVLGLHHDPKYFPEPENFDPERFSEQNRNSFPNFSYIPFGEGPRSCIGERLALLAIKLGLIHILMNFELEPCAETPVPMIFEPKHYFLVPAVSVPLKFKKLIPQ